VPLAKHKRRTIIANAMNHLDLENAFWQFSLRTTRKAWQKNDSRSRIGLALM